MSDRIPPPRASRDKPNISTTNSLISGETPEKVEDILATGGEVSLPVKKRLFYPLWYTRDLKNGVGISRPIKSDIREDCGELE